MSQDYPKQRAKAVMLGAAALLLADAISGAASQVSDDVAVKSAFDLAEAFVAEAEKRLGGKIDFDD